ncbi:MAG: energy transducer TonB [Tannerella sp.]|jgi:hypothetical protein|nr:energy transducer TonB [Tannerella sp.]
MKNTVFIKGIFILLAFGFSIVQSNAQSKSVADYYYPKGTTEKKFTQKGNLLKRYDRFTGFDGANNGVSEFYSYWGQHLAVTGKSEYKLVGNEIVYTKGYNTVTGSDNHSSTVLILPDVGQTVVLPISNNRLSPCEYTLVNLQIEINGQKRTVNAIKELIIDDKGIRTIEYWVEGKGPVFDIIENEVFSYNASIGLTSLSYKESPINNGNTEKQRVRVNDDNFEEKSGNQTFNRNRGSSFGNTDSGTNKNIDSNGSFTLSGRTLVEGNLARLENSAQEEGKIVIDIIVDNNGNIIFAAIGKGTTIKDVSMLKSAIRAAREAKFNRIGSTEDQKGTITYIY